MSKITKLTVEEALHLQPIRAGKNSWLTNAIAELKVGEAFLFSKSEWKSKATPYLTIRKIAGNLNVKVNYGLHPDGKSYLVKRIE